MLLAIGLVIKTGTLAQAQAQTPPTPPPPPASPATREVPHTTPRPLPDFSGTWTIDRNYSNDPAQANFGAGQGASRQGGQSHSGSGGRGGGFGGFGGFGRSGGSGGTSGGHSRNDASGGTTADEQARLTALTDELKKGASTLTISHHDPSFVVTNGLEHAVFCQTTGERQEQHFGDLTIPTVTNWEGDRIVTEFDLSSRRRLTYAYTLLENSKQLVLRVRLEDDQGSRGSGTELKLVYRMGTSATR